MIRRQIITPDDAHKFFGDCRAAISASADREGAWFDCAKETGRKVRAKEIGPAYAADQLREVIREQSLFADDSEDDIQATIAATFERTAEEPGLAVNGHEVIVEEPPEDYGVRPTERTEAETPPRFTPIAIDDIELAAEPAWLVYRLLPARGLACIVGPPKCGKSFMTTDMLFSVVRGGPYAGRGTLPGPVIFLTGEGVTGFKRRLIAMRRHYGVEGQGLPFFMIENVPDLGSERTDVHGLLRELDKFIADRGLERPASGSCDP